MEIFKHNDIWDIGERKMMSFNIDESNAVIDNLIKNDYSKSFYPL